MVRLLAPVDETLDVPTRDTAPPAHNHAASEVTSGVLTVPRGGTGVNAVTASSYLRGQGTGAMQERTAAETRGDIGADNASNLTVGTVGAARLGSGTADGTAYLRGDSTWATFDTAVRANRIDQMAAPTAARTMNNQKLTGLAAGTTNGDSLRYEQVVGLYLLLTGGTLSGNLAMGSNKVTGLAAATANGDAVRYEQMVAVSINEQTGTSYTLVLSDAGKLIRCNNASAFTLTVPPNSSVAFPTGCVINLSQSGAGQVTVSPGSGVTLNKPSTHQLKTATQYAQLTLVKTATDTWLVGGHMAAV